MKKIIVDNEERLFAVVTTVAVGLIAIGISLKFSSTENNSIFRTAYVLYGIGLLILSMDIVVFAITNQFLLGWKFGLTYTKLKYSLKYALYEAGKGTINSNETIVDLPKIEIYLTEDLQGGKILIQNSPRFSKSYETFDISSALGNFVVDDWHLTANRNYYIYNIYDYRILKQKQFNNLESYEFWVNRSGPYELRIDERTCVNLQHMLICGATRSGKTYMLYHLLLQSYLKEKTESITYHWYFADPKKSSVYDLGRILGIKYNAYDPFEIIKVLEAFDEELKRRQEELAELQLGKLDSDYRTFSLEPYILVFDEFATFTGVLKTMKKEERDKVDAIIRNITLTGAGCGFFWICVMQKSDSSSLPTMVRDSMTFKTVLGSAEQTTYITAFGNGVTIPKRQLKTGEGLYTNAGYTNDPKLLFVPSLNFDIKEAFQKCLENEAN